MYSIKQVVWSDIGTGLSPLTLYVGYDYEEASSQRVLYFFSDPDGTNRVYSLDGIPTKSCYTFGGLYVLSILGTALQICDSSGTFSTSVTKAIVNESLWNYVAGIWNDKAYTLTLDAGSGTGSVAALYYAVDGSGWFTDADCTTSVESPIAVPKPATGYKFTGYYSAESGGTQYIDADGNLTDAFYALSISAATTIYAQYEERGSLALTLDSDGGTGAPDAIYYKPTTGWCSDEAGTDPISSIDVPVRSGYTFNGFLSGETTVIDASGAIVIDSIDDDTSATASWSPLSYTLTFDYNGGTEGGVSSMSVTMGEAVGDLPETEKSGLTFDGWRVNGRKITTSTKWSIAADSTAVAAFIGNFGGVVDYFGLESDLLIPESSSDGAEKPHTVAYNATSDKPATDTGCTWLNPSVSYRVADSTTISAALGSAFDAEYTDGVMTKTGYMITSIEVHTAIGEPPVVTVSAVANEGADAVQTYSVSIPVLFRHRPQNLLSAVHGGGELQELTLRAFCDPVVVAENNLPCASDVCHGRYEVAARTNAYSGETAPTATGGFTAIGSPVSHSGTGYKSFSVNLVKEM